MERRLRITAGAVPVTATLDEGDATVFRQVRAETTVRLDRAEADGRRTGGPR